MQRRPPIAGWVSPALLLFWHADWQHGAYPSSPGVLRGSLLRWLATALADNIWALQSWCKKRFEGNEASMDAFFKEVGIQSIQVTSEKIAVHAGCKQCLWSQNGVTEDMDYIT